MRHAEFNVGASFSSAGGAPCQKKSDPTPEEREAQFQAFVEASRELECDEDPETFKGIVRKVAGGHAGDGDGSAEK